MISVYFEEQSMAEQLIWHGRVVAELSPRAREKVFAEAEMIKYKAGTTILREGDHSKYLFIIKGGQVVLEITVPPKGRRSILTVGPGELFSWSALVEPRIENASARASVDTEAKRVDGVTLMKLCEESSSLGFEVYRTLAKVISSRLIATRLQFLDVFQVG
jgi:CRP/FNR family cyclic AMP-dependent transcriptional regulator